MSSHFTMRREPEPTETSLQIRRALRMGDDDALQMVQTWRDAADETHGRLSALRERDDADEPPTAEEMHFCCAPIHHYLSKNGEDADGQEPQVDYPRGSREPVDLPRSQQQREGVILPGHSGLVVDHGRRR